MINLKSPLIFVLTSNRAYACNPEATSGGQTCAALIMQNRWEITYW